MLYNLGFISYIFWPLVIIGIIIFLLRRRGAKTHPAADRSWYLQLALSKEDAVSQWFFLLAVFFLGTALLALNRDLGDIFKWQEIVLFTSLVGLTTAYYFKLIFTLLFSLAGFVCWWGVQASEWTQPKDIKSTAILFGFSLIALLFYTLGHLHEKENKFRRFAMIYLVTGIIPVTAQLFFFSTKVGLAALTQLSKGGQVSLSWETALSLLVLLLTLSGVTYYSVSRKLLYAAEAAVVSILVILFGLTAILPQQIMFLPDLKYPGLYNGYTGDLTGSGVIWAVVFNIAVFFELLGLILSGYFRKEEWLINLGTFFLFVLIIVKYFDWFFSFIDKSLFFIGAGILLFAVGWLMEKSRRYMITIIKTHPEKNT